MLNHEGPSPEKSGKSTIALVALSIPVRVFGIFLAFHLLHLSTPIGVLHADFAVCLSFAFLILTIAAPLMFIVSRTLRPKVKPSARQVVSLLVHGCAVALYTTLWTLALARLHPLRQSIADYFDYFFLFLFGSLLRWRRTSLPVGTTRVIVTSYGVAALTLALAAGFHSGSVGRSALVDSFVGLTYSLVASAIEVLRRNDARKVTAVLFPPTGASCSSPRALAARASGPTTQGALWVHGVSVAIASVVVLIVGAASSAFRGGVAVLTLRHEGAVALQPPLLRGFAFVICAATLVVLPYVLHEWVQRGTRERAVRRAATRTLLIGTAIVAAVLFVLHSTVGMPLDEGSENADAVAFYAQQQEADVAAQRALRGAAGSHAALHDASRQLQELSVQHGVPLRAHMAHGTNDLALLAVAFGALLLGIHKSYNAATAPSSAHASARPAIPYGAADGLAEAGPPPGAWATIWRTPQSRRLLIFLVLNVIFMFAELATGLITGSLGMISDAFHMAFDSASLAIACYAAYMVTWSASPALSYGYSRYEVLSGFTNGVLLILIGTLIFFESIGRLFDPPELGTDYLISVSIGGLLINVVGVAFFHDTHGHGGHGCGGHGHGGGDDAKVTAHAAPLATDHSSHTHSHSHSHGDTSVVARPRRGASVRRGAANDVPFVVTGGKQDCAEEPVCHGHGGHSHAVVSDCADSASGDHGHSHSHGPANRAAGVHAHGHGNLNLWGVYLHICADLLGSIGVLISSAIVAAGADKYPSLYLADPICSLIISTLIVVSAIPLLKETASLLMQATPEWAAPALDDARAGILRLRYVEDIDQWHWWEMQGSTDALHGTVRVRASGTLRDAINTHAIAESIVAVLVDTGVVIDAAAAAQRVVIEVATR